MAINEQDRKPGFQGSETSGAEVILYPQGGDPVVVSTTYTEFLGRSNRDEDPSLISANTSKQMGAPSGNWSAVLKAGRKGNLTSFFDRVVDDDWVDISFYRHRRKWHVMRGLIDNVQRQTVVAGTGATSEVFTLTGRDFGKIFEITPVWFNPYSTNALGGEAASRVFGVAEIVGNPLTAVKGFLIEFFKLLQGEGQASWRMPDKVPNVRGPTGEANPDFLSTVVLPEDLWEDLYSTVGINQNYLMPNGTLWQLAQEWSDPLFNELFVDTVPGFLIDDVSQGVTEKDTEMRIIFRNRPFPTLLGTPDFFDSEFPLFTVPRQQILSSQISRSGDERFNAYFASPLLIQEALKINGVDALLPLWDLEDVQKHGLRRFDVSTKYASADADDLVLSEAMRATVRDWYCMNPYLYNGTFNLRAGRPDIHIGSRIRVPGSQSADYDETYYVESVAHAWNFGPGLRTDLGVTRGWKGSDDSYLEALNTMTSRYAIGQKQPSA